MKAVVQSYKSGDVSVVDVPAPRCPANGIVIRTVASLVSIGTERSMIELGRKSLLGKARARPDLVRRALEKAKREGYWKTFQESLARLDESVPLGYSSAGVVIEAGAAAHEFSPGDRVACVGQTFASHAEFASVPAGMACRVPAGVTDEEASFAMLGAIAMHGARSTQLGLGGTVAIIGLGLLGILTAQILRAYGCRIVGFDPDPSKMQLCRELEFRDVASDIPELQQMVLHQTNGAGCDAVIIAAATKSSEPVSIAVNMCRQKGRVVILGVADIHPDRNEMWKNEVEIVVSKAGGLGALDPVYERDGIDIPIGAARWTQGRNVAEFLRLIAEKKVVVDRLITHRSPIASAGKLYGDLIDGALKSVVGVILTYPGDGIPNRNVILEKSTRVLSGPIRLAVMGAGLYGKSVFLPTLARNRKFDLGVLVTGSGISGDNSAKKFGFRECSTDGRSIFARNDIDAVIALLPHSQHSGVVMDAVAGGKHLLVEKPLCVSEEELVQIEEALSSHPQKPVIMVGHNRRYSGHTVWIREQLRNRRAPLVMTIRINAGHVPHDHWVHSEKEGRSRIVGEGSHFVDLAMAIVGSRVTGVHAMRISGDDKTVVNNDNYLALLRFSDGSIANICYTAQGPRSVPREVVEIYSEGNAIVSTDFRLTERYSSDGRTKFSTGSQDYGYADEIAMFAAAIEGAAPMDPGYHDMIHVMRATFAIEKSLAEGVQIDLDGAGH